MVNQFTLTSYIIVLEVIKSTKVACIQGSSIPKNEDYDHGSINRGNCRALTFCIIIIMD